jgi:hypothetical protein
MERPMKNATSESEIKAMLNDLADQAPTFVGLQPEDRVQTHPTKPKSHPGLLVAAAAAIAGIAVLGSTIALLNSGPPEKNDPDTPAAASDGPESTPPTPRPELASRDQVRAVANRLNLYEEPGYGKVAIDFKTSEVRVYWKGTPPAEITDAVQLQPDGVIVSLIAVEYSANELEVAGNKVFADARKPGRVPITHVQPQDDLSGIRVGIAPEDMPADPEPLRLQLEEVTGGVPVTIEEGSSIVGTVPGSTERQRQVPGDGTTMTIFRHRPACFPQHEAVANRPCGHGA